MLVFLDHPVYMTPVGQLARIINAQGSERKIATPEDILRWEYALNVVHVVVVEHISLRRYLLVSNLLY